MSVREFVWRYVGRVDRRHARLAVATMMVSGWATVVTATLPITDGAREAATAIAGLSVIELFALITLASLGMCGYLVHTLLRRWDEGVRALTKISTDLDKRPCFKVKEVIDIGGGIVAMHGQKQ